MSHTIVNPKWATEIAPTYSGLVAKAWLCEYELPAVMDATDRAAFEATLRQYIIHAPGAHPFWSWYYMAGISLRDIPGAEPAKRHFEGATHELMVMSLDPDKEAPRPNGKFGEHGTLAPLDPPDHVIQTMFVNDEQFGEIVDLFAKAVVNGGLSPDSDWRERWRQSMTYTVDHYRGLHDE